MSKYTPGPWEAEFGETYNVRDAGGGRLAMLTNLKGAYGMGGRRNGDEVAANARLIAAAPDLLEALQGLLAKCAADGWWLKADVIREMDATSAAIAKATGEAA